jgi:hypothetical protein
MRTPIWLYVWLLTAISCTTGSSDRSVGTDVVNIPISPDGKQSTKLPALTFDKTEIDVGRIAQGEVLTFTYPFKNTGKAPLVISAVEGSCGCSVPKTWPTGKVMPGEGGTIEVDFDSGGKSGPQVITISVVSNTLPSRTQLVIRAHVAAPNEATTTP